MYVQCLGYIEDQLSTLFARSCTLAAYVHAVGDAHAIDTAHMARVLGVDLSDVPLLMAVAGVHSPNLLKLLTC
jgi:hypothetical protein